MIFLQSPLRLLSVVTVAWLSVPVWAQPASLPPTASIRAGDAVERVQDALANRRERLPEIARAHGLSVAALEALAHRERDLWIDAQDRLLYVCEGLQVAEEGLAADGTRVSGTAVSPSADAFKLHSFPGASRVIYLDFNGHVTSGTSWNSSKTGGADIVSAPFDFDGNPTAWSTTESDRIKRIWQRVAEDFAHFAVDVTTEDPGVDALRRSTSTDNAYGIRVVISPSSAWYGSAGGVAYLQSFQWSSDTPCFVFSDRLGPNNEKYVAEAISHEVGHTLSLSHDGQSGGSAYYQGHGDWAPIMGVGYYRAVSQWSKGEYTSANNTEDDLARMPLYGAPLAVDDHGNTLAAATPLTGASLLTYGVIETRGDVDVFKFNTGAGAITLSVAGPSPASNLDVKAELLNAAGSVIASSSPTGLAATISATVASGTYHLRIDGVGTADPLSTGYSDYGSIGEYRLTGTVVATTTALPPVAKIAATPVTGTAPLLVNFSSAGSSDPDGVIAGYSWTFGDGGSSTAANPSYTYTTAGSFVATLTVIDAAGLSSTATIGITVAPPANQPPVARAAASVTSGPAPLAVAFSSSGSTDADGAITAYHWSFGDGTSSTAANPGKTYTTAGTYTAVLTVTDDRGATGSANVVITVAADNSADMDVNQYTLVVNKTSSGSAAIATVKVGDRLGRPVAGASVTVQWSGLFGGTSTATTNASGVATLTSRRVKKSGTITGTVSAVVAPSGYRFVSTLFAEPMSRSVAVSR